MIEGKSYTLHTGNNLDILPTLPDNSVDSIVTDPPYELGFMGKKWDNSGIAYSVELWTQCLRVLKPGGHLLSFGGTRTWHRVAVAIEDAGFEVRDSIAWMYGSGFPKSLDVSKAIDKRGGVTAEQSQFAKALQDAKNKTKLTIADLNEVLGKRTSNLWSHFVGEVQPQLPSASNYWKLKKVLPISDEWDYLFKDEAEREVIAERRQRGSQGGIVAFNTADSETELITAPATPEAKQWEGWGTALKPAFEPIVVARKPLIGTVAENVLTYGTGGLNIDGSRIGKETIISRGGRSGAVTGDERTGAALGMYGAHESLNTEHQGRWPANVILDEYSAELLDEQTEGKITQGHWANTKVSGYGEFGGGKSEYLGTGRKAEHEIKGASRFFYVAKASKRDRNEGLEDIEGKEIGGKGNGLARTCAVCGASIMNPCECPDRTFVNPTRQNFHPTVKPTDLMRYLIKLVTPPGGVVLDPFTGSGSTGKAAILEGFRFIGCELTEDYIPIIQGRLDYAEEQARLAEAKKEEALF